MDVYLNGVLDDGALVGTVTATQQNSTLPVTIGKRSGVSGFEFNGRIDEVRIYPRALSAAEIQSDMNTPVGSPLVLLGQDIGDSGTAPLTKQEIRPLFDEAVKRWGAALGDMEAVERLSQVRVEVMDLPGTLLGLASSTIIYIDTNAAGHGWFVDETPWEDSEFAAGLVTSPAADHADLLTTLAHELGHILGRDDDHTTDPYTGDVMADALPLGVRRINLGG